MEYRRANIKDVDPLLQNRIEFVMPIQKIADIGTFKKKRQEHITVQIENLASSECAVTGQILAYVYQITGLLGTPILLAYQAHLALRTEKSRGSVFSGTKMS